MDVDLPAEDDPRRVEVRAWFTAHPTPTPAELVDAGYVETERIGRRNRYTIDRDHAMRHSAQLGYDIGALIEALAPKSQADADGNG